MHKITKLCIPLLTLFFYKPNIIAPLRLFWTIFEFCAFKAVAVGICILFAISIKHDQLPCCLYFSLFSSFLINELFHHLQVLSSFIR